MLTYFRHPREKRGSSHFECFWIPVLRFAAAGIYPMVPNSPGKSRDMLWTSPT